MKGNLLSFDTLTVFLVLGLSYVCAEMRFEFAHHNPMYDNIYETRNALLLSRAKYKSVCFMKCVNNLQCRSFSYNVQNGACQHFSEVFFKQPIIQIKENGWIHYDSKIIYILILMNASLIIFG